METSLSNLPNIFEDLKNVIQATREVNVEKSDTDNVEDITMPGTRVVVLWKKEMPCLGGIQDGIQQ